MMLPTASWLEGLDLTCPAAALSARVSAGKHWVGGRLRAGQVGKGSPLAWLPGLWLCVAWVSDLEPDFRSPS